MEKKVLSVGLIVGLLIGSMLGYGVAPSGVDTTALENQIGDLNSQVNTLQSQVQTKNETITDLQGQVSDLESEIQSKKATITELEGNITKLAEEVTVLESEIETKKATITELQGNVTALNTQVSVLESEIASKNETILGLQGQVSTLEDEVKSKNETIAQLEEDIETLRAQLEIEVLGVYFSPDGGCKNQVIYWASRANESIHVLIYSFTLDDVSDALIEAYNSGVEVQVVFEKQQISKYSEYPKLKQAGVAVRNDTNSGYMHNKVMIIDETIVLTGSFNWSAHAEEQNNENLIVIKSTYIPTPTKKSFRRYGLKAFSFL